MSWTIITKMIFGGGNFSPNYYHNFPRQQSFNRAKLFDVDEWPSLPTHQNNPESSPVAPSSNFYQNSIRIRLTLNISYKIYNNNHYDYYDHRYSSCLALGALDNSSYCFSF